MPTNIERALDYTLGFAGLAVSRILKFNRLPAGV